MIEVLRSSRADGAVPSSSGARLPCHPSSRLRLLMLCAVLSIGRATDSRTRSDSALHRLCTFIQRRREGMVCPSPVCTWPGARCAASDGSLVALDLSSYGLSGTIPSELGQLSSLTSLHLDANALTGSLPSELGQLTSLQALDLSHNALTFPDPGTREASAYSQATSRCSPYTSNASLTCSGLPPHSCSAFGRRARLSLRHRNMCVMLPSYEQEWIDVTLAGCVIGVTERTHCPTLMTLIPHIPLHHRCVIGVMGALVLVVIRRRLKRASSSADAVGVQVLLTQ